MTLKEQWEKETGLTTDNCTGIGDDSGLLRDYDNLCSYCEWLETRFNWKNTKTNSPKERKIYFVGWVGVPVIEKMIWTSEGWYWPPNHSLYQGKIDPDHEPTHWRELPQPPTENME